MKRVDKRHHDAIRRVRLLASCGKQQGVGRKASRDGAALARSFALTHSDGHGPLDGGAAPDGTHVSCGCVIRCGCGQTVGGKWRGDCRCRCSRAGVQREAQLRVCEGGVSVCATDRCRGAHCQSVLFNVSFVSRRCETPGAMVKSNQLKPPR